MSSPQAPMVRKKKKARRTKQLAEWHTKQAMKGPAAAAPPPPEKTEKAAAKTAAKK